MVETLRDARIPPAPWVSMSTESLTPTRDDSAVGTAAEFEKLAATSRDFHAEAGGLWEAAQFEADLAWHASLLQDE